MAMKMPEITPDEWQAFDEWQVPDEWRTFEMKPDEWQLPEDWKINNKTKK